MSDSTSAPANHAKPTAVISSPKRFSGRRHQANTPVPMKLSPMSGPRIAVDDLLVVVAARQDDRDVDGGEQHPDDEERDQCAAEAGHACDSRAAVPRAR